MDKNYHDAATQAAEKLAEMPLMMNTEAGRQSTRVMLMEHVERLRREAHQLEALAYQIDRIGGEAEQMLYSLLSGAIFRR